MIKSLKFKDDYICFFKNQSFEFKGVTLLVGDQGCGKSTMLSLLFNLISKEKNEDASGVASFVMDNSQNNIIWLDMERDNPNTTQANPYGSSENFLTVLTSKWRSHGENLLPVLRGLQQFKGHIILIDEPETALSLRSQYYFIDLMKELESNGNQIIISTHCMTFLEAFRDNILSLEHNRYISIESFIKSQKKPSEFKYKRDDRIIKKTKCKMGQNCKCANETGWYNRNCEHYVKQNWIKSKHAK